MDIDNVKFIEEIEKRPATWDMLRKSYSDLNIKKREWQEIIELFGGDRCSDNKGKEVLGISLQKKWKNLRDSFARERRRLKNPKSGSAASRKSCYMYYNNLLFLSRAIAVNETETNVLPREDIQDSSEQTRAEGPYAGFRRSHSKKRSVEDPVGNELVSILKEAAAAREAREIEERTQMDDDKLFLLSLHNDLASVPNYLKLQTKMEIIQVIQRAQKYHNSHQHSQLSSGTPLSSTILTQNQQQEYHPGYFIQSHFVQQPPNDPRPSTSAAKPHNSEDLYSLLQKHWQVTHQRSLQHVI
ncbi:uncharacterized protein LOC117282447 [Cryptotermes secundus]|uniref:uncharacterized protein LOC117282447 n=1 Tax=Cryptotermes secundus TaxID=105785 RepID=UPI001454D28D|nr:uncharacterized protein LOC117282447 [Cryptotermes secundus]